MIARAKTFGSPSGEPSTTRPYDSTNVRKTLDTTCRLSLTFACVFRFPLTEHFDSRSTNEPF
jgi:hypothetical protein